MNWTPALLQCLLYCAVEDSGERTLFGSSIHAILGLQQIPLDRWMWRDGYDTIGRSDAKVVDGISVFELCGPGDEFLFQELSSIVVSSLMHNKKRLNVAAQ